MAKTLPKKRLYSDDYIKYGFTFIEKNGSHLPQCVICHLVLSNDAMRPGRLERHLTTNHAALKDKPTEFFVSRKSCLKRMKLDSSGSFRMENEKAVEASYKIALLIAKDKKPHTIGESLIKPCLLTACSTVLSEDSSNKIAKIALSNDTIKRRIDDMAIDLKNQLVQKLKNSPFFALQCDETTDISKQAQLLFYCRYIDEKKFVEEILFSKNLESTTKAVDIFTALQTFLEANDLPWGRVIGICTDGAQAMTGCRSGFIELAKKKNPKIIGSHCIIHRQALACQTLPESLNTALNLAVKVVNHVKSSALNTRLFRVLCQELNSDQETLLFHTEVRWLSKGNMLARLFNLKSEVEIFLMSSSEELYKKFTDDKFIFYLAYLSDFFETINLLNLKLQGQKSTVKNYDSIKSFSEKMALWQRRLGNSEPNFSSFPKLNNLLNDTQSLPKDMVTEMKDLISEHLLSLKSKIEAYFPDISSENWEFKLTRDPFQINVDLLPDHIQEQTIDLQCDSKAKVDFPNMDLEDFWLQYLPVYPEVAMEAAKLLVQFSSTYLCESGFSALADIKSKYRARLDVESDLRCSLSKLQPNIKKIVNEKQCQPSH